VLGSVGMPKPGSGEGYAVRVLSSSFCMWKNACYVRRCIPCVILDGLRHRGQMKRNKIQNTEGSLLMLTAWSMQHLALHRERGVVSHSGPGRHCKLGQALCRDQVWRPLWGWATEAPCGLHWEQCHLPAARHTAHRGLR